MPHAQPLAQALRTIRAAGAVPVLTDARATAEVAIPWLLPLTDDHQGLRHDLLATTLDWALRAPCSTWLSGLLPTPHLAERLRQRTEAVLPENQAILLRCYDPRVLPELHKALHPAQAKNHWALGHTWAYLDRTQQVKFIALSSAPAVDEFTAPLMLDQAQFVALMDASEVDTVMPELAREAPDAFLALRPADRASFTRRCLALANEWHLQAFAQRVMVGVLTLKLGEDFHQRQAWVPWIAKLKAGQINLIQAIEGATAE